MLLSPCPANFCWRKMKVFEVLYSLSFLFLDFGVGKNTVFANCCSYLSTNNHRHLVRFHYLQKQLKSFKVGSLKMALICIYVFSHSFWSIKIPLFVQSSNTSKKTLKMALIWIYVFVTLNTGVMSTFRLVNFLD